MRRPRPRFWAWTLTLTAALLAVVWVGSMRLMLTARLTPTYGADVIMGGIFLYKFAPAMPFRTARGPFAAESRVHLWDLEFWLAHWLFERRVDVVQGGVMRTSLFIPLWPFVLLTGVPGVWMLVKTRKRTNPNACPACGYDRTGLPQTSTGPAPCPECGKT